MIGLVNITILLQNNILIEFSDNLVYNTFNLNKRVILWEIAKIFVLTSTK